MIKKEKDWNWAGEREKSKIWTSENELNKQKATRLTDCRPCMYYDIVCVCVCVPKIHIYKSLFRINDIGTHRVHLWESLSVLIHMLARAYQLAIDICFDTAETAFTLWQYYMCLSVFEHFILVIAHNVYTRRERNPHTSRALSSNNRNSQRWRYAGVYWTFRKHL